MCHWNLNAIAAHNFSKINLLKAYFTIRKADIAYLSETYLDSSFLVNYENLVIQGYNLVRCDHPTNSKSGGVCIYYKDSFPLKIIDIQYLQECINFHLIIGVTLLRFTDLLTNLMMNLIIYKRPRIEFNKATTHNSFLVVVLGDFNAKSCNWCINDKANFEGAKTDTLTSQNGLHQIIKEHIFLIHYSLALTYFYITTYVSYEFWCACFFTCELSSSDQFCKI